MKVVFPVVKANTGSDVFFRLLAESLLRVGIQTEIIFLPVYKEVLPLFFGNVDKKIIEEADLLHTCLEYSSWFSGLGKPLISTLHHDVFNPRYRVSLSALQKLHHDLQIKPRARKGISDSKVVVCDSNSTYNSALETYSGAQGKFRTILNGINTDEFSPDTTVSRKSRQVLIVGSMTRRKGVDLVPGLLSYLQKDDVEVIWVTQSHKTLDGVRVIHNASRVELLRLYRESTVLVSLSRLEGFGYTIVEAMSCGTPVITFDHSSFSEIVDHGVNGYLCDCYDQGVMAEHILGLCKDMALVEVLGQAGREKAVACYSHSRMIREFVELYTEVLGV